MASSPGDPDAAVELERLGYPAIWLRGGELDALGQIADVVRATRHVRVSTGIISVDRFDHDSVAGLYTDLEGTHPGRFVVGLGGAHGPNPLQTLNLYLDALDASVPRTSRVMAALGSRMLALARDRAAGAFPVLVTPSTPPEHAPSWATTRRWPSMRSWFSSLTLGTRVASRADRSDSWRAILRTRRTFGGWGSPPMRSPG